MKSGWTILVQDESIFVYDYVVKRKKWISADKRPIVTVTGSRKRTIVLIKSFDPVANLGIDLGIETLR